MDSSFTVSMGRDWGPGTREGVRMVVRVKGRETRQGVKKR